MSRARLVAAALALAVTLAAAAPAAAWSPISGDRPAWCSAAPYALNSAGSADLGIDTTETEVRRGMDDWTRVSCTSLATSYGGRSSARAINGDRQSVIAWVESSWPHDPSAIGVTTPQWTIGGGSVCIVESDMQLNGVNYRWITTSGSGGSVNTYSIVLHEGGHFYGLGHTSDPSATMYPAYGGGISMLATDDRNGICSLYPGMGGGDCTATGCPSGEMCVSGTCTPIMGDGTVCSPCRNHDDCGGASDYCLGYPDGGFCGKRCFSNADCDGDYCAALEGGGSQCVRVDSTGTPSCSAPAPGGCRNDSDCGATERCNITTSRCEPRPMGGANLGEPCESHTQCNSGVCLATPAGSVCSQSCDWLAPTSCPSGFYCSGTITGSCGSIGLCVAGVAGALGLGEACSVDTDCSTLLCSEGVCATPCIPGGAAACTEAGYACQVGPVDGCGACKMTGRLGDACTTVDDCGSRNCACRAEGDCFCTAFCDDSASRCPGGFACTPIGGDQSVCVPTATPGGDGGTGGGGGGRRDGGCCAVAGARPSGAGAWWALIPFVVALALRRSRRKH